MAPGDDRDDMSRAERLAPPPAAMATMLIHIAPELIAVFKSIVEAYDNLATMRTEDPQRHLLKLTYAAESAADVERLIASLAEEFAIERVA